MIIIKIIIDKWGEKLLHSDLGRMLFTRSSSMMARSTKKASSRSKTTRKASPAKKKTAGKKTVFHKLLTAEGWKRLMMGKMRKKSK